MYFIDVKNYILNNYPKIGFKNPTKKFNTEVWKKKTQFFMVQSLFNFEN